MELHAAIGTSSHMDKKKAKELLTRTAVELVAAKELLREKKKKIKKEKDSLVIANTKREIDTVALAVQSIQDHRELLKQQIAGA
jgi:hypothetical protein